MNKTLVYDNIIFKEVLKMFNMKLKRVIAGLTQEELAQKAGISRAHVTRIERGSAKPSVPVAKKLARILNVNWGDFYND